MQRRTLIKTGLAGAALLAAAGGAATWWRRDPVAQQATVLHALIPALLEGALPQGGEARSTAIAQTAATVQEAIRRLAPEAQQELGQLFALLASAPGRRLLAGVPAPWEHASVSHVTAFLQSWRTHRLGLMRSGYGALHDLVLGSWYAEPAHWSSIGYAGPRPL